MSAISNNHSLVSRFLTGTRGTDIQICKSMLEEYRSRAKSGLLAGAIGMVVLFVAVQALNPNVNAVYWTLYMALILPLEFLPKIRPYIQSLTNETIETKTILLLLGLVTMRGLGWGFGGALFFEEKLEYEMFLAMVLCCIAVLGAAILSTYLLAAIVFIVCVLTPSIVLLLQSTIPFFRVLGYAGIAYCGIAIWFAVLTSRLTLKGFRLSHANSNLVAALQEANSALQEKNSVLNYALAKIEEVAVTDELTGCYNRRYLMDTLRKEVAISQRDYRPFSLLLIDADYFKKVNDSYGHLVGDRVLFSIAQTLKLTVRGVDTLARFGGEEFACMLPGTTLDEAKVLADRVRYTISKQSVALECGPLNVTVSIGVAEWQLNESIESVIHRADLGLYAAKAGGRNCVVAGVSPEISSVQSLTV